MRFFVVTLKYKKRAAISDHPLSHTKPMRLTMFWLQYIYSSIGKVLNLYQCWQCYCLDWLVYCFHLFLSFNYNAMYTFLGYPPNCS